MKNPNILSLGDTIGVIAPSRPIYTRKGEFKSGLGILEEFGFKIKLSKNIYAKDYYSAGQPKQRSEDLNEMFADKDVKAIICATGGITSNQILKLIDYDLIRRNPKIFIGYSDNTNLLQAIYKKTGLVTFHGPDVCELSTQNPDSIRSYGKFLTSGEFDIDSKFGVIRDGECSGTLTGGNLFEICGLLGSEFSPNLDKSVLFWEDLGQSPAVLDYHLNQLKLSGKMENIAGMVVGHLDDCVDKKYSQDNKPIEMILLEVFKEYSFPIIKVDYFGHEIQNFKILPIGLKAKIDTDQNIFEIK